MSGVGWRPTSRRAFLASAASIVALPFLPSLLPRAARADDTAPLRLVWWFVPNGMQMPAWNPTTLGTGYDVPRLLEPIEHHLDRVSLLRGITTLASEVVPPHLIGTAGFLTAGLASPAGLRLRKSVDQIAAGMLGTQTRFPSLQLGTEGPHVPSNCDAGFSCQYVAQLSWADEVTPLPPLCSARLVFDRMFGGVDAGATEADRARRTAIRTSVLDHVLDDLVSLEGRVGVEDRARLDRFATGVRELERDIALLGSQPTCETDGLLPIDERDPTQLTDRMSDLMALSLACDLTRVVTFASANGGSTRSFDFLGIPGGHHQLSHHGGDPALQAQLEVIDRWEMERFAYALDRFSETEDFEGSTLLDNLFLMFGSEVADGNEHALTDLPTLVAGGARGGLVSGRALSLPDRALLDVHLTGLHLAGLDVRPWANGTGPITELIA